MPAQSPRQTHLLAAAARRPHRHRPVATGDIMSSPRHPDVGPHRIPRFRTRVSRARSAAARRRPFRAVGADFPLRVVGDAMDNAPNHADLGSLCGFGGVGLGDGAGWTAGVAFRRHGACTPIRDDAWNPRLSGRDSHAEIHSFGWSPRRTFFSACRPEVRALSFARARGPGTPTGRRALRASADPGGRTPAAAPPSGSPSARPGFSIRRRRRWDPDRIPWT